MNSEIERSNRSIKKVHFIGIGGAGAAPTAVIAKKLGFNVTGCDINSNSYYIDLCKRNEIEVYFEHNIDHIIDADIVAVSPAVLLESFDHEEIMFAKKLNKLVTWQEFCGKYLQKNREVIAVAGTHGKSTSTLLLGSVLERLDYDPIVLAGTKSVEWGSGVRIGSSNYFICEADEYNDNFLNYSPSIAIINNIEFDHPEFFGDIRNLKNSFKKFILRLVDRKILIVNLDSSILVELLYEMQEILIEEKINVIGFSKGVKHKLNLLNEFIYNINEIQCSSSQYTVSNKSRYFQMNSALVGDFNISNSMGVFVVCDYLGIDWESINKAFKEFKGLGRRFELKHASENIMLYDDFAHHPTSIKLTIKTLRDIYGKSRILSIFEPHMNSRIKSLETEFIEALELSNKVVILQTFIGREHRLNIKPYDLDVFRHKLNVDESVIISDYDEVLCYCLNKLDEIDIIIVFGAGNAHLVAKILSSEFKNLQL